MKINVEFESLKEMIEFAEQLHIPSGLEEFVKGPCKAKKASVENAVAEPDPEPDTEPAEEPAEEPQKEETYTLVDVRGKLSELTKAGKKDKVQELIKSFGVDKLSQIPSDKYAEMMEKAGEL